MLSSVLTSEKAGVALRRLEREYETLIGTRIPYRRLGYSTLEEFLRDLRSVVRLARGPDGETMVHAVLTEATAHVAEMVKGQKSSKPKPMARPAYRRPMHYSQHNYRPNSVLTKFSSLGGGRPFRGGSSPSSYTSPAAARHKPGYEIYHPPSRRSLLATPRERTPSSGHGAAPEWGNKYPGHADGFKKKYTGNYVKPPSSSYQTPPRFQKARNGSWGGEEETSRSSRHQNGDVGPTSGAGWGSGAPRESRTPTGPKPAGKWGELDGSWVGADKPRHDGGWGERGGGDGDVKEQAWGEALKTAAPSGDGGEERLEGSGSDCTNKAPTTPTSDSTFKRTPVVITTPSSDNEVLKTPVKALERKPPALEPDQKRYDPFREPIKFTERFDPFRQPIPFKPVPEPTPTPKDDDKESETVPTQVRPPSRSPVPSKRASLPNCTSPERASPESAPSKATTSKSVTRKHVSLGHISLEPSSLEPSSLEPSTLERHSFERATSERAASEPDLWEPTSPAPSLPPQTPFCSLVGAYAKREGVEAVYSALLDKSKKRGPGTWLAKLKLGGRTFNSYPNEKPTADEAKEEAARKAVEALNLLQEGHEPSLPVTPASTDDEVMLLVERIATLVAERPQGILSDYLPKAYEDLFAERLPDGWLNHVRKARLVNVTGTQQSCILYPYSPLEMPEEPPYVPVLETDSSASSSSAETTGAPEFVDVYITCVTSTDNVCFRFGEYERDYEQLLEDMRMFYEGPGGKVPPPDVAEGELYATCVSDIWLRVQTQGPPEDGQVECYFVDQGGTSTVPVQNLKLLDERFALFPLQAFQCQLDGLVEYASCENAAEILVELLLGKSLVAEIIRRVDPVPVVLFDTWGPEDVDLNMEIFLRLMAPRLPPGGQVAKAFLSHVRADGTLCLQMSGVGLGVLNSCMAAVNQYCESSTELVDKLVESKLYACRFSSDGRYYRAVVSSADPLPSGQFHVRYVDFGNEEAVFLSEFRDLDALGDFVVRLPHQVVECRLKGLEKVEWSEELIKRLVDLADDSTELLLRVTEPPTDATPALVIMFKRLGPSRELLSINEALLKPAVEES